MSVTSGFFNALNGDRKYNAEEMSSIFDGIIEDGILQHVGTAMVVTAMDNMNVYVGIGRAWFNHTWTLNDSILPLEVTQAEVLLNRYDAVVLDVDARTSVRANTIKIINGAPGSSPSKPEMLKDNDHWQYPLAYIYVAAGVTSIGQENITNCVGTSECPFVTAPLEKMDIDALIAKWEAQWNVWTERNDSEWASWTAKNDAEWTEWTTKNETDFKNWFNDIKGILGEDAATSLADQILQIKKRMVEFTQVTLTADGWIGDSAPYAQTIEASTIVETDQPLLVSALEDGAAPDVQKAYVKAFGIIASGTGTTGNGNITFKVYKKPDSDITVKLKMV